MNKNKKIEILIEKWKDNNFDNSCFKEKEKKVIVKYAVKRKKYILQKISNTPNINRDVFFPLMNEVEKLNEVINMKG